MRWKQTYGRRLFFAFQSFTFFVVCGYLLGRHYVGFEGRELLIYAGMIGGPMSYLVDVFLVGLFRGLGLARFGSKDQRLAVAHQRAAVTLEAKITRCANANEAGDLVRAAECLAAIRAGDREHPLTMLVRHRFDILGGDPSRRDAAIEGLMGWHRPQIMLSDEVERYHAFALASSLKGEVGSARAQRAAEKLLAHSDPVVRGYGSWLTLRIDASVASFPELRVADPAKGAELARAAGETELADALETEVARRVAVPTAPYRRPR